MKDLRFKFWMPLLFILIGQLASGQISVEKSVQLMAELDTSNSKIHLSWLPVKDATSYRISERRGLTSWTILESVDANTTSWTFEPYNPGDRVEFRVEKMGGASGYGYISCGFEIDIVDQRGKCLLVVDSSLMMPLQVEIDRWRADVEGDGWVSDVLMVGVNEDPADIRDRIINWSFNLGQQQGAVFLLGSIPVPYSGEIFPDGHTDHIGAWPADVYYAEMNGNWSDDFINITTASDPRNHNIPGDGKFDQNTIPGNVELQIGRADLSDLPAFPDNYVELTRKYLDKNHAFRNKDLEVKRRGLIENNFPGFAEGFGQNGWKNFTPMFGPDSVHRADYETVLSDQDYMWAYACGAGSYTSMGGVGNTTNLYVNRDIKSVFVMNFGSYFGDWDKPNNLLRAALASGTVLTNAWAARPNWQFHHMALGNTIGYATMLSQNNGFTYVTGFGGRSVHVALMGDPTLRMHSMTPISGLTLSEKNGTVEISWSASPDALAGYVVYRKKEGEEHFMRLNSQPILQTRHVDECIEANTPYEYQVKAVKLESSSSGTYYNTSIGKGAAITPQTGSTPAINFTVTAFYERIQVENLSSGATIRHWDFGDGSLSSQDNTVHLYDSSGTKIICLTLENDCGTFVKCDTIHLESSFPEEIRFEVTDIKCHGDSTGAIAVVHSGGVPQLRYDWSTGHRDSVILELTARNYQVILTSTVGLRRFSNAITVSQPDEIMAVITTTPSSGNNGTAKVDITGGVPPYTLTWGDGTLDPDHLPPGMHQLTIKDANDCIIKLDFEIKLNTAAFYLDDSRIEVFPVPSADILNLNISNFHYGIIGWSILDVGGRMMKEGSETETGHKMHIDINDLPAGTYRLNIMSDGGSILIPILKI